MRKGNSSKFLRYLSFVQQENFLAKKEAIIRKLDDIFSKKCSHLGYDGDIANALEVSADELLSFNIEFRHEVKSEFSSILERCSTYEKKVITDVAKALKQSLQDDRRLRRYD